jgi:hypothetical protein
MNILLLTNEFPPHIYGGAGIHVQYLSREVAKLMPVHVRCFGDQNMTTGNLSALGFSLDSNHITSQAADRSWGAQRSLDFNTVDLRRTWCTATLGYVHWAGIVAKLNHGIPLAITVHSLEPCAPGSEQLRGMTSRAARENGYRDGDAQCCPRETRNDIEHLFTVRLIDCTSSTTD